MFTFGTLLWIDELNHSAINNKNKNIVSYFRQVDLLAKTLRSVFDTELVVFTNNPQRIGAWFSNHRKILPKIIQIEPSFLVPTGFKFFGAHFKLDAIIAGTNLLKTDEDRFFLLDTDVIANKNFDSSQHVRILSADLIVFDISAQVFPAYGHEKIQSDIELVAGEKFVDPKWFGGEFVGGSKLGLTRLVEQVRPLLPVYFASADQLHHVGDEMFVTAAINKLLKANDLRIINQVPYRLICRHWSRHTDQSLRHHMNHSFVHCPGSKPVLEFLSQFTKPTQPYSYIVLRCYQLAVLFYQRFKSLFK